MQASAGLFRSEKGKLLKGADRVSKLLERFFGVCIDERNDTRYTVKKPGEIGSGKTEVKTKSRRVFSDASALSDF